MRPYLVYKTWVDLDHVLAIEGEVSVQSMYVSHYNTQWPEIRAIMMFTTRNVIIRVGEHVQVPPCTYPPYENLAAATKVLDDFIAAWKSKHSA